MNRILAILLAGPFMAQADISIVNVATPSIHAGLHASGAALELVISAYLIACGVLIITGARLGQTHGYRRMFLLGAGVFGAASLLCGLAPGTGALIAARALQGAGAALMFPQTLTGIQLAFEGEERVRAIGLYALALSSGAVVGMFAGGVLTDALGWRAVFLVNVPIAALVVFAGRRVLPADGPRTSRAVDLPGVATLSLALLLLVIPLALGRSEGWPAWTWVSLAACAPALAAFAAAERRAAAPLMNLRVLARPRVGWALVTLHAATGTYYALLFTLAQYLQRGLGHSASASGLTVLPWVAAFGLAGQVVRRLPARRAHLAPAAGCLLLAAAYATLSALLLAGHHAEGLLVAVLGIGGLGLGLQFSSLIVHLADAVPAGYAPDISGVSTTILQISGTVGVATFGTLYLGLERAGDVTHAFAVTTAAFAAVALLAAVAGRRATASRGSAASASARRRSAAAGSGRASAGA
jgi:MFS family permease